MRVRALSGSAALTFYLAVATGCAARPSSQPAERAEPAPEEVVLEVDNHNWSDVLIYVVHDGSTTRFAQITAARSESIPVPSHLVGSNGIVRFVAHRIGGLDDYYSPAVSVRTGQTIALTLEGQLNMSSIGVW